MPTCAEFFGQGLANPGDAFFSHQPRWTTTAQCKLFWTPEFAARVSSNAQERLRASLPPEFAGLAPVQPRRVPRGGDPASRLPAVVTGRSNADGQFGGRTVPIPRSSLDRVCQRPAPDLQDAGLNEKYLLREAMRKLLPPSILGRRKLPYRAPDAAAFLGTPAPDYVNELMGTAALKRHGYFDAQKVGRLIAKLRRNRTPAVRDNMAFMGILSTQLWHAEFMERNN